MLYGKYQCGKGKCLNEWTSAAAVEGSWQMCLKCKNKATPYYLREHDRREDEIEKGEEGKATQRKNKVHIQAHCGECLRLATEKAFMQTCLEYWAMKANPEKEAKAQREADKKRPMIKAEMKNIQKTHVDLVKSFTRDAGLDSSRVEENNNASDDKNAQQAKKKNKRKPKKKQVKKADVKTEPVESKGLDKKQESHVDFVKSFTEKAENESSNAAKKADGQNVEKPKKKRNRKSRNKKTTKSDVKTEPVDTAVQNESNGDPKQEQNNAEVKKEQNAEVKTEVQQDKAPKKATKKTKNKSINSGSSSPNLADNNNLSEVMTENTTVDDKKSKKKRYKKNAKKASSENKENVVLPSENTSPDDLVSKIGDM